MVQLASIHTKWPAVVMVSSWLLWMQFIISKQLHENVRGMYRTGGIVYYLLRTFLFIVLFLNPDVLKLGVLVNKHVQRTARLNNVLQHHIGTLATLRAAHPGTKDTFEIALNPHSPSLVNLCQKRVALKVILIQQSFPFRFELLNSEHLVQHFVELVPEIPVLCVLHTYTLSNPLQHMPLAPAVYSALPHLGYSDFHGPTLVCYEKMCIRIMVFLGYENEERH